MIASGGLTVHRLLGGPWDENCYVASAESGDAVVVDPGDGAAGIVEHLTAHDLRPRAVLATHGHHDHVGAAAELAELCAVPFGIHSGDSPILRRMNLARFALDRLDPVALPTIGIDLAGETRLRLGALEVVALHTPGHTPGGVCFEIRGALFTGDTLLATGPGRADLLGGDPLALQRSLAMLKRRYPPPTPLHPGHGEPGTLGEAVGGGSVGVEAGR